MVCLCENLCEIIVFSYCLYNYCNLLDNQIFCLSQDGSTAIHQAAQKGHLDVFMALRQKGANMSAVKKVIICSDSLTATYYSLSICYYSLQPYAVNKLINRQCVWGECVIACCCI